MKINSKFLMLTLPLAVILAGVTVYEYGYLQIRSDVTALEGASWQKEKILKKYLSMIADKPLFEKKLAAVTALREVDDAKIIEGQTPSIAAAAMQNTVKGMILAREGTISSDRIEKAEGIGKFKIITVFIDAVFPDVRALSDTLFAIETQTPYLVIREVDASVRNYQMPKELTVRLKISGLTGGR
jgi:hypothetical protein